MADDDSLDGYRRVVDAAALARLGRGREALALLRDDVSASISLQVSVWLLRASILEQLVEGGEASLTYADALMRFPHDATVLLRAGVWTYRTGDLAKAEMLLRRSWDEARLPETGYYLGLLDNSAGRRESALEMFCYVLSSETPDGIWRIAAEKTTATLFA